MSKAELKNLRVITTPPKKVIPVEVDGVLFECKTLPAVKASLFGDIVKAFAPALEVAIPSPAEIKAMVQKGEDFDIGTMMEKAAPAMIRASMTLFYDQASNFVKFVAACTGHPENEISALDVEVLRGLTDACLEANENLFFAPEIRDIVAGFNPPDESESTTSSSDSEPTDGE